MTDNSNQGVEQSQTLFDDVLNTLGSFKSQITMLTVQVKALQRTVNKEMKVLDREAKKNRMRGNKKPSGFAVPNPISSELCDFMKKPEGSSAARTEVTSYIIQYISDNNLQNPNNKQEIKPDVALKSLLEEKHEDNTSPKAEAITYFNIQRYMNRHFVKA